jgi:hypothetical protein
MATASKKAQGKAANGSKSMEFVIVQSNSGEYRWEVVDGHGAELARSGEFASYDEAAQATEHFRDGVATAVLDSSAEH